MNVLVTLVFIAVVAMWAAAVYSRLSRMREQVMAAWRRLETNQFDEAVRAVYNRHVAQYNETLKTFPANLVGPATGFKPAKLFEPPRPASDDLREE